LNASDDFFFAEFAKWSFFSQVVGVQFFAALFGSISFKLLPGLPDAIFSN
jgi:hypothetical protein